MATVGIAPTFTHFNLDDVIKARQEDLSRGRRSEAHKAKEDEAKHSQGISLKIQTAKVKTHTIRHGCVITIRYQTLHES